MIDGNDVHVFHFKINGRRCSVYSHAVVHSAPTHAAVELNLRSFDETLLSKQEILMCFTDACGDDASDRDNSDDDVLLIDPVAGCCVNVDDRLNDRLEVKKI